ncbi:MAG: SpoIIE family protein phosphatase [Candidatus Aminicenantes bacterium]|jgi:serine phosphatase RsbU (regulator of sigma subunit)
MEKLGNRLLDKIWNVFCRKQNSPDRENAEQPEESSSDTFALPGILEKKTSPLNEPVWSLLCLVLGGSFFTWLIRILFGTGTAFAIWLAALAAFGTWLAAIRMLLLVTKLKKFWIILLAAGFVFLVLTAVVPGFVYVSGSIAFVFLLFRRYKPYRHLTSRRRAALFLLGLVAFTLLTVAFPAGQTPTLETAVSTQRFEQNLAKYSVWSLRLFWFLSLFNLFFAIRLHFMKIRPKLAVSSFLITVVPVFLVVLMSVVVIYSTLGLSRASRAKSILQEWARSAAADPDFIHALTSRSFIHENDTKGIDTLDEQPSWLSEFLQALRTDDASASEWTASDTAKYLWSDQELWLVHLSGNLSQNYRIVGGFVDERMMDRLANILHSDVKLSLTNPIRFSALGEVKVVGLKTGSEKPQKKEIAGKYLDKEITKRPPDETESSIWQKKLYSGMNHLDVTSLSNGKLDYFSLLLLTEGSVGGFVQDLISERNPLSLVVMVGLIVLAILLLVLEAFAFYFGVRITGGITSAVKALHRGTRRISQGELDTRIEIPNEDELGDLANSFNIMTEAIKRGQEEAVAREHLERELKTAREIQERLLPDQMPQVPGFDITGTNIPSLQVGGDYFDFLELESGYLGIAIADVCGKGIPAALLMANLQAGLHGQAVEPSEVASVISRMNDLLVRSTDSHIFATFFYGILDRTQSTFTSTNAGHNPPLLFKADGEYKKLGPNGLIIGFLPNQEYKQHTSQIKPGDVLILYTDGITEATRAKSAEENDKYFGEERLVEVVKTHLQNSAREIQSEILKAISDFTAGAPQNDDITLVVIKRNVSP